jgi:hypothetical protein
VTQTNLDEKILVETIRKRENMEKNITDDTDLRKTMLKKKHRL